MNRARRVAAATLATPILAASAVVATAAPAAADADIKSPSGGSTVTGSTLSITAESDGPGRLYLNYKGDEEDGDRVAEGSGTLSYEVSTHEIPNGTYDLSVQESGPLQLIWYHKDDASFTVEAPPATPTDVGADAVSSREVEVSWSKGPEPDLAAYTVSVAGNSEQVSVSDACSGEDCSATLTVPASSEGEQVTASVEALRYTAGPGSSTIDSSASGDSVDLPGQGYSARAANSPSPSGVSMPSPSGMLPTGLGRGQLPAPTLQPLANDRLLQLPQIGPRNGTAAGVPQPRLPEVQGSSNRAAGDPATKPAAAAGTTQWWKTIALGFVLLLVAAHLGAWSWRTRPARSVAGTGGAVVALAATRRVGRGLRSSFGSRRIYQGRRRRGG